MIARPNPVEVGYQVFLTEGGETFGAVHAVFADELVIYVENSGDFVVKSELVARVHDGKVILDGPRLDSKLWSAIARAHEREEPSS
jgi:hypothetical protein